VSHDSPPQNKIRASVVAPARFLVAIGMVCLGVFAAHLWNRLRITNGLTRTAYAAPSEGLGATPDKANQPSLDPGSANNAGGTLEAADPG